MSRTFVRVELEHATAEPAFCTAMSERGFVRTVKSRATHKQLRMPPGMFLIERTSAREALELTRDAARNSNTRVRIFCVPVEGKVRFSNLLPAG